MGLSRSNVLSTKTIHDHNDGGRDLSQAKTIFESRHIQAGEATWQHIGKARPTFLWAR
ncbi:hypothetical protein GCM10027022_07480 [Alpinimonas psychrophila]